MPHRLTVLATTDVHGNALSWDYYADRPFEDHEVGRIWAQFSDRMHRQRVPQPRTILRLRWAAG